MQSEAPMTPTGSNQLRAWIDRTFRNDAEAALALQVSAAYLSYLLRGERVPGRDMALKIETVVGIPVRAWSLSRRATSPRRVRANGRKRLINK